MSNAAAPNERETEDQSPPGPHPSVLTVARKFIFEHEIQQNLKAIGASESREPQHRILGVAHIDSVRKFLKIPYQTFNTAAVYYHKFRLTHIESSYDYRDAALAALFTACKIEDTLKKSKEICCAAYNMKISTPADYAAPDDPMFEGQSRVVIGIERLMLESAGFAFVVRHPQMLTIDMFKLAGLDKDTTGLLAYDMTFDLHGTFAPLKHGRQTMAFACVELAARLHQKDLQPLRPKPDGELDYSYWRVSRAEVMETLLDLLDLYTHHRTSTKIGPLFPINDFITIRIALNQEASRLDLQRYTNWREDDPPNEMEAGAGMKVTTSMDDAGRKITTRIISPQSPSNNNGTIGERGREGTVRFVFDPERAHSEKNTVKDYFKVEEVEEYKEEEVPDTIMHEYHDYPPTDTSHHPSPARGPAVGQHRFVPPPSFPSSPPQHMTEGTIPTATGARASSYRGGRHNRPRPSVQPYIVPHRRHAAPHPPTAFASSSQHPADLRREHLIAGRPESAPDLGRGHVTTVVIREIAPEDSSTEMDVDVDL